VKPSPAKRRRIQLGTDAYHRLHQEILKRDGWRCQACGSLRGLEVHHIQRRSQSGDDSEGNLITLCCNLPQSNSRVLARTHFSRHNAWLETRSHRRHRWQNQPRLRSISPI